MRISIKREIFVIASLILIFNSLYFVLAQDTIPIETVNRTLLKMRQFNIENILPLSILLVFIAIGIVLLIRSKSIKSKSLKTSIILPLIFWIMGLVHLVGSMFSSYLTGGVLLDFGAFLMYFWLLFAPIILVSIGFSIFALVKLQEKKISTTNLILNIIYLIIWIIFVSTVRMG